MARGFEAVAALPSPRGRRGAGGEALLLCLALTACWGRTQSSPVSEIASSAPPAEPVVHGFWEQPAPPWSAGADAGPEAQSGSRLRARYHVAPGGARRHAGFEDTLRHETCVFRVAADGVTRCLPDGFQAEYTTYLQGNGCSELVFSSEGWCHQAPVYGLRREPGCSERTRVYTLGAEFSQSDFAAAHCTQGTPPELPGRHYFRGASEVDPSAFVAATSEVETSGARLRSVRLKGADGSRQWAGWYDAWMEQPCVFQTSASGDLQCLPEAPREPPGLFADKACQLPLLTVPKDCPADHVVTVSDFSQRCPFAVRAFVPGARDDGKKGGNHFVHGVCEAFSSFGSYNDRYRPGPEVPAEVLVTASVVSDTGGAHVQRRLLKAPGGISQLESSFHDRTTGQPCEGRLASDGKLRCLPVSAPFVFARRFADAACQQASVYASSSCSSGSLGTYLSRTCPDEQVVCQYGSPDKLYFYTDPKTCLTNDVNGPMVGPGYVWRRCEQDRPVTDFDELSVVVE